jgi:hypothetical protein
LAADLQNSASDSTHLQKTATPNFYMSNLARMPKLFFLRLTSTNLRQRKETLRQVS